MDRRLLALLACLCCTRKPPPAAPDAAQSPASADALQPSAVATPEEDDLKPVYSGFDGKPLPLAQKLCDAVYEIPAARIAACCKSGAQMTLTPLCTSSLSAALRSKGVSLEAAAVDACVAAQAKAHEGCSWVGAATDPLPPECRLLIKGLR